MSPCKACGKEILMALDAAGQHIPLDPAPEVYMVSSKFSGDTNAPFVAYKMDKAAVTRWMVPHTATCNPNAAPVV